MLWPRLAPAPTPADADPKSASNSAARLALKQLLSEITEVSAKAARLAEIERQRLDAEAEEAAAGEAFEAIVAAERDDMQAWSRGGCQGAPPSPRADQRVTAQQRVAGANARAQDARRVNQAIETSVASTNSGLARLQSQKPALVAAVLVEHAREIAARYSAALRAAVRSEIALAALRRQLADLGSVEGGMAVALMMREGVGSNPTVSKPAAEELRREIAAFVQRLALDADTPFPSNGADDGQR